MSSKLAQFLHQERLQTATLQLNIAEVRKSVDDLVLLIFPERGCLGLRESKEIEQTIKDLKIKFTKYIESVAPLKPEVLEKAAANA
jgi:hypothetical protein